MNAVPQNPAARVRHIIGDALRIGGPGSKSAFDVWSTTFELSGESIAVMHEVTRLLGLLYEQLQRARQLAPQTRLPQSFYDSELTTIAQGLLPIHLNAAFTSTMQQFRPDTLKALEALGHSFHEEGPDVPLQDRAELAQQLRDFEAEIAKSEMDPRLRNYVLQQIGTMRRALRDYRIRGVAAFGEALDSMLVQRLANEDVVSENAAAPELTRLGRMLGTLQRWAPAFTLTNLLLGQGGKIVSAGQTIAHFAEHSVKLLGSG